MEIFWIVLEILGSDEIVICRNNKTGDMLKFRTDYEAQDYAEDSLMTEWKLVEIKI